MIAQERIPIRLEKVLPRTSRNNARLINRANGWWIFAPYLFLGKLCGFLTRLTAPPSSAM